MSEPAASVRVEDLSYAYPSHDLVLRDINLIVRKGEMFGIIGPNGAGKSTLCKALNGLVPHFYGGRFSGHVYVADMDTMKHTVAELSLKVGFVFQDPTNQFSGVCMRVDEEVAFGMSMLGFERGEMEQRIAQALKQVGLSGLEERSPFDLSGGQQQRLAIATVLAVKPEVIVLDEPTAQLDPIGKGEVFETLRALNKEGYTIIVAEHEIEELASFADRIAVIDKGQIVLLGNARETLVQVDSLKNIGVDPPSVTELTHTLATDLDANTSDYPISLPEAIKFYLEILKGRRIQ